MMFHLVSSAELRLTQTFLFLPTKLNGWFRDILIRVLQTIPMKLILLCVWAEWVIFGSSKTALKFKHEI